MNQIDLDDLQRNPSDFVHRVEAGETLLLVHGERAVAAVAPVPHLTDQLRPFGLCAGQFSVPDDFDEPLPEDVLKQFYGK